MSICRDKDQKPFLMELEKDLGKTSIYFPVSPAEDVISDQDQSRCLRRD